MSDGDSQGQEVVIIDLGSVTCPSGILVILDPGYMRFWSGRSDPKPPVEEFDNPDTRARVASSADYGDRCANAYAQWCPNSNLFEGEKAARTWTEAHGVQGRIVPIHEADSQIHPIGQAALRRSDDEEKQLRRLRQAMASATCACGRYRSADVS